jgi:hypothetical protein
MDIIKSRLAPEVQSLIVLLDEMFLKGPYEEYGKNERSWKDYNIVFPNTFGSAQRRPITQKFQEFTETVFWPMMNTLLYGHNGWKKIQDHHLCFKVNTIKISEGTFYYNKDIYHMHLDNKIDHYEKNDEQQLRSTVFSVIPSAISINGKTVSDSKEFGSAVYIKDQPLNSFFTQNHYHKWMGETFEECGLKAGNLRQLYRVELKDLFRSKSGEIGIHHSHPKFGSQEVHAEANPAPDGRILVAIDFQDTPVKL